MFLFLFVIFSCNDNKKNEKLDTLVNEFEYKEIYIKAADTLKTFQLNKIGHYSFLNCGEWYLDSLFCLNSKNDRIITAILYTNSNTKEAMHDGIQFLYGEKINDLWYFFKGASIHLPREMVKGQDVHKPLTYQQLHQVALKEVYGGYLNSKGEINEEWFIGHFENVGWCSKCKTSEDFRKSRLEGVGINWIMRDTAKPILQLP